MMTKEEPMPARKKTKPAEPKAAKTKQAAKSEKATKETSRKTGHFGWSDRNIKGHIVAVNW